ncbi:MAG: hypothetical protein WED09_05375 [Homoserinimonas sp.]
MKKAIGAALMALLVGASLAGCVADEGTTDSHEASAIPEATNGDEWQAITEDEPLLGDRLIPSEVEYMTVGGGGRDSWGPSPVYSTHGFDNDGQPGPLVLGPDGVIDIVVYFSAEEIPRTIDRAYVTDREDSEEAKTSMECITAMRDKRLMNYQVFKCTAKFMDKKNQGGTYFPVIETSPSSSEHSHYGAKRAVGTLTLQAFGSSGDLCVTDGTVVTSACNSLPKRQKPAH